MTRASFLRMTTQPAYVARVRARRAPIFLSDGGRPTFFGYHDKTPFSADGSKALATSVAASDTRADSECTPMRIGYFPMSATGSEGDFVPLAMTSTWCWQQGCMLQWNPASPDRQLVFNALVDDVYGAMWFDLPTGKVVRQHRAPVYSLHPAGTFAVTLNFSRLGRLRPGYGYRLLPDETVTELAPASDGLFLLDLASGEKTLLASLVSLASQLDEPGSQHYVNHATFSPDGRRIAFFHILLRGGSRKVRLCVVEVATARCVEIESERTVSHYCWRGADELLATARDRAGQFHYSLYALDAGTRRDLALPLRRDGHPMIHPLDSSIAITDTYPDRRRDQHLCTVSLRDGAVEEVATLYSPFKYGDQVRCDLHPRWDRAGKFVAVDTTARGRRELALIGMEPPLDP